VSNITNDSWGGFAVTLIDALDTMLMMGLTKEFAMAQKWIHEHLDFDKDWDASFFEYTIRYLGGLLSAFELSGDKVMLVKATDIGNRLLKAFDGSPSGLPYPIVNLRTGVGKTPTWNRGKVSLSEIGSCQLEFESLSHHTGDPRYAEAGARVYTLLDTVTQQKQQTSGAKGKQPGPGIAALPLLPLELDIATGTQFSGQITLGGRSDSYYEYLLKVWMLTGKTDKKMQQRYQGVRKAIERLLVKKTVGTNLTVLVNYDQFTGPDSTSTVMEHLACFAPGMLMLGAMEDLTVSASERAATTETAAQLTETCWQMYNSTASGLAAESYTFHFDTPTEIQVREPRYVLRPETSEALFWMWKGTRRQKYRDQGRAIFQALKKHCRCPTAYSGLVDVRQNSPQWNDSMQSFLLSETFKYLYMLFSSEKDTKLQKMIDNSVFTTEGHILRRFKKTGTQRKTAGKKTKLTVAEKTGTKISTTAETI